jgi:BNR/Asp-box repeat
MTLLSLPARRQWLATLPLLGLLLVSPAAPAAEWEAVTTDLIKTEKPGYGKLCGVLVDHHNGDVYVDLSDKGIYRSTDQGKTWKRTATEILKGRTETPGCMMFVPRGNAKTLVVALVYGAPIAVSADAGVTWLTMNPKSSHVDWCAVDWNDPALTLVLALKHESGGLLIASHDGGKTFTEVGKGFGPAWIFDNRTVVVAESRTNSRPKPGLVRTTDGGKTFQPCGDYHAAALPRWRDGKLYWVVDGALISTSDKSATWKKISDLKDGRFGPVFGKNADHLFVLTGGGIVESSDAGATWSKALPLPPEVRGGALTWMEYDPVGDVLYVMRMSSELYRMKRGH